MRVYRSVCTYIWNDDKFPYASDDCQLVWFHIFTNPLSSPLGVFRASLAGLAEDKNRNGAWPLERYTKAFQEAFRQGFVKVDSKALLIAFPKYFSPVNACNHPQSPNVVKSWGLRFHELPQSPLKQECYQSLKALLEGKGEAFMKAFLEAFGEVYPQGMPNTDPNPNPNPNPEFDIEVPLNQESVNKKRKIVSATGVAAPGVAVWDAYAEAYRIRYRVAPIRNAKVNSQLAQLVKRVGKDAAPHIATFYVEHNLTFYVSRGHPVDILLRDAETLHTQWANGSHTTQPPRTVAEMLCKTMNVAKE